MAAFAERSAFRLSSGATTKVRTKSDATASACNWGPTLGRKGKQEERSPGGGVSRSGASSRALIIR